MGGDLNLKKSWHPQLYKNQERVWAEEKKALAERKKTELLLKERAEERQLLELRQLQEAAGGKKVLDRVEFLYSGPGESGGRTEEEREAYLLGKRSVVGLLKGNDNEVLKKGADVGVVGPAAAAVNARDTAAKIREDPLLAIKRREQEALKAYVSDPLKRRKLEAAIGGEKEKEKSKRHRDDDRERRRRHHRSRSRSPRRDRGDRRDRDGRRDRSPRRDRDDRRDRSRSTRRDRDYSKSPRRDRDEKREDHHSHRHRSRERRSSPTSTSRRHHDDRPRPSRRPSPPPRRPSPRYTATSAADDEAERAKRLAEMQSNASALDADRAARLAALAEKEKAQAAEEEAARLRNNKLGGRAQFLNKAHRQAGELDLAERVGRGRQGMREGRDEIDV
jgi:hypothetical protein